MIKSRTDTNGPINKNEREVLSETSFTDGVEENCVPLSKGEHKNSLITLTNSKFDELQLKF